MMGFVMEGTGRAHSSLMKTERVYNYYVIVIFKLILGITQNSTTVKYVFGSGRFYFWYSVIRLFLGFFD